MKYLVKVFLLLFLCVSGSHLFAFGTMTADEVRILFTGKTVECERREAVPPGVAPPDMLENYVEELIIFFAENGTVKLKIGAKHKTGKWRVIESGNLCLQWKGRKEKCAPVYKSGKAYKRVVKNKIGRVLREIKFIKFTPGNVFDL